MIMTPDGAFLSAAAKAMTPKISPAPGSLVFALAISFPEAEQKQSDAGNKFPSLFGLAGQGTV